MIGERRLTVVGGGRGRVLGEYIRLPRSSKRSRGREGYVVYLSV